MHPISWLLAVAAWGAFLALATLLITRLFPSNATDESLKVRPPEGVTISDAGGEPHPAGHAAAVLDNTKTIAA